MVFFMAAKTTPGAVKTLAVLGAVCLLAACSIIPSAPGSVAPATPALAEASSGVSSYATNPFAREGEWDSQTVSRNRSFADYMTAERYDVLFGTAGILPSNPIPSPDGMCIAYFYPAEFEEPTTLFKFDLTTQISTPLLTQDDIGQQKTVKAVSWQDKDSLLLIIGNRYGTISPGGCVYLLDLSEAPKARLLYVPEKETEQVLSAMLADGQLSMTIAVFDLEFLGYTEQDLAVPVEVSTIQPADIAPKP